MHRLFDPVIDRSAGLGAGLDWKTSLQELTASGFLGVPEYHVEESGPDHQKFFRATVRVGGRAYGSGSGRSKKEAEQQAAEAAWKAISNGTDSAAEARPTPRPGMPPAGEGPAGNGPAGDGPAGNGAGAAPGQQVNGVHPAAGDAGPGGRRARDAAAGGAAAGDAAARDAAAGHRAGSASSPPVPPGDEPAGD